MPALRSSARVCFALCFAARLGRSASRNRAGLCLGTAAGGLKHDKTRCINVDHEGNVFPRG